MEFGQIWGKSGNLGKIQGNSVEFSGVVHGTDYEFSGNSWGISGQRLVVQENLGLGWSRPIWGVERLLR